MQTISAPPSNYAAITILRAALAGEIIFVGFGTHMAEIDTAAGTPTTENYFTTDAEGNLTVAADLAEAPAILRCISTTATIVDITLFGSYVATALPRAAAVGQIVAPAFGELLNEIDPATGTSESYFTVDGAGNLTVGADLAAAPAIIRCVSAADAIVDITLT